MTEHVPPLRRRAAWFLAGVAIVAAALTGCGASPTGAPSGKLSVVAAENVWGDIASQIGGSHVTVTSIISDPNADPHTYETDPRTRRQ